jgi:dipeptidyl aminopeptidase/acylaminoacyl peptidase
MKIKHLPFLSLGIMVISLSLFSPCQAESLRESRPMTIDDLMRIKNIEEARISPDGHSVLYVISEANVEKNVYERDIWLIETDGRKALKLTNGPGRDDTPRWSPDGKEIAFISDRDGNSQIWLIKPAGGEARKLTESEGGVGAFFWSPDGKQIAYLLADQETEAEEKRREEAGDLIVVDGKPKMVHIHLIEVATKKAWKLTEGDFSVDSLSWAPDGKSIVFSARPSPSVPDLFNTDIYTVDVQTAKIRRIVERDGADASPVWSPDGKMIAFVSNDGRNEWIADWYICLVAPEGGPPRNISKSYDEFISSCFWSSDSQTLYFRGNRGVTSQLYAVSAASGAIRQVSRGQCAHRSFSFSRDSTRVAFLVSTSATPSEVYVSSLRDFSPNRLTWTNPLVDQLDLGVTEVVRWKSYDGLQIEGLLIKPVDFREGKRFPLLTYVHGGPSGKFGKSFSPQIGGSSPIQGESYPLHVLAGQGFGIFLPNPRGSYGYGEKFRMANVRDWGHGDYLDILSGIDHLIDKGLVDPDRLGIMGRSYGGYMTAWIITQTDRFKAASLGAGMSNLISFYGQTDIPGYMEYYFGGDPWKERKDYTKRSPITHAPKVRTPTLIIHGENDARVPLPQAWEFYRALKKNKIAVEFIIYPRQGHSIREPKFQMDDMRRNLEWFSRWLGGSAAR